MLQRVFVDADVLASRTPYEWLALLRAEDDTSFQLHSSSGAVVDAVRLWRRRAPAVRGGASRRRLDLLVASLDEVVGAVAADVDFDAPDRPVIPVQADAMASGAQVLVSSNVSPPVGDELPFEIYTPDELLCLVDDSAASAVRNVTLLQDHRARRPDAGRATESLTATLTAAGCPAFAERVAAHLRALAG